tara:strand:- start:5149 stop:5457 length:309 start_codon:yes stop_codon:yes gene_type:complete
MAGDWVYDHEMAKMVPPHMIGKTRDKKEAYFRNKAATSKKYKEKLKANGGMAKQKKHQDHTAKNSPGSPIITQPVRQPPDFEHDFSKELQSMDLYYYDIPFI